MTDAEKAFEAAEWMIEEARETGADDLDFNETKTHALEQIPDSISSLSSLRVLDLGGTAISDLTPLAGLTALTGLALDNTSITDLNPLSGLSGLSLLSIDGTAVSDLAPLVDATAITELRLANTSVTDLEPISKFYALQKLQLMGSSVTDLRPISNLINLIWIGLADCDISDVSPLIGLHSLEGLGLEGTSVLDLRPLTGLKNLGERESGYALTLDGSTAYNLDENVRKLYDDEDRESDEFVAMLFDYLKNWVPPSDKSKFTPALQGPILSDSLIEIEREADQFYAASLTDVPAKPLDRRHDDLLQTLSYISSRVGGTATENRLGKEICQNFVDYGQFVQQSPVNGRILWFISNGVRAVLSDPYKAEALDGFDTDQIVGFLSESDALIQEYYPDSMRGAQFETETSPDVLSREMPAQLQAARNILAAEDARGVFAVSVSDTLEMLIRREEGARRGYLTAATEEGRKEAGQELQRVSVQSTAILGRIKGRLTQWLKNTGDWAKIQAIHAKDHPVGTVAGLGGASSAVYWVITNLTPIFDKLWKLIGNLPLPGF